MHCGFAEDRSAAETARNEAEQVRRLAEEALGVRDHHREALEAIRQEPERLRETETARRQRGGTDRGRCDTSGRVPIRRGPMASPSASFRRCCVSGPTSSLTKPRGTAAARFSPGCGTTIWSGRMRA
jgi:hypothetical protein